jgi:hypothetical protein
MRVTKRPKYLLKRDLSATLLKSFVLRTVYEAWKADT